MKKFVFSTVIMIFLLSACNLINFDGTPTVDTVATAVASTLEVQNAAATLAAGYAEQTQAAVVQPTEPPAAIPPTEVPTMAPTEVLAVKATANDNTNCRLGPDKAFALVELMNAGASGVVIGQFSANGQWWKLHLDSGKECWVFGTNVSVAGDTTNVPQLPSPATPTPVPPPTWTGRWTLWLSGGFENTPEQVVTVVVDMVQTGNQLTYSFSQWGFNFNAYLTVSADGMVATGTLTRASPSGSWTLRLERVPENLNQFRGEWYLGSDRNLDGMNCGGKNGAAMPEPCRP